MPEPGLTRPRSPCGSLWVRLGQVQESFRHRTPLRALLSLDPPCTLSPGMRGRVRFWGPEMQARPQALRKQIRTTPWWFPSFSGDVPLGNLKNGMNTNNNVTKFRCSLRHLIKFHELFFSPNLPPFSASQRGLLGCHVGLKSPLPEWRGTGKRLSGADRESAVMATRVE